MRHKVTWQPVEDGFRHEHKMPNGAVISWCDALADGAIIRISNGVHLVATELPENIRLCIVTPATDDAAGVPPSLVKTLQAICDGVSFYELDETDREVLRQVIAEMKGEGHDAQ